MTGVQPEGDRRRRTRRNGPGLRAAVVLGALALAPSSLLAACTDDGSGAADVTTTLGARPDLAEMVAALGCLETAPLDGLLAPIRGGAARDGTACDLPGNTGVHVFARAPLGDPDGQGWDLGGRIENIDRLVGTRPGSAGADAACPALVLVGTGYFVVGDDAEQIDRVGSLLGHVERPARPAAPMTSYLAPPCRADVSTADGGG